MFQNGFARRSDEGYLFRYVSGPSIAGKNTVAKLWQNYRVRSGLTGPSPTSDSPVSNWDWNDWTRSRPIVSEATGFSNLAPLAKTMRRRWSKVRFCFLALPYFGIPLLLFLNCADVWPGGNWSV